MTDGIACCDKCFDLIAKQNTNAARVWFDLCEIQTTCEIFGVAVEDNLEFQTLETLRFITTTDHGNVIVVKVHGDWIEDPDPYFCGGVCGHRIKTM